MTFRVKLLLFVTFYVGSVSSYHTRMTQYPSLPNAGDTAVIACGPCYMPGGSGFREAELRLYHSCSADDITTCHGETRGLMVDTDGLYMLARKRDVHRTDTPDSAGFSFHASYSPASLRGQITVHNARCNDHTRYTCRCSNSKGNRLYISARLKVGGCTTTTTTAPTTLTTPQTTPPTTTVTPCQWPQTWTTVSLWENGHRVDYVCTFCNDGAGPAANKQKICKKVIFPIKKEHIIRG